jgi:phage shock protein PspC (stress-responsive transcriptional regulator)
MDTMTNPHHGDDEPTGPVEQPTKAESAASAEPPHAPTDDTVVVESDAATQHLPPQRAVDAEPDPEPEAPAAPTADTPPTAEAPPMGGPGWPPPSAGPTGFAGPTDPPPPFASRLGLVRPIEGRKAVGVCAAIARATNTDPILWRVLFAVLTLFGGLGLLAYLVGWLVIQAEGDTTSPVESLVGRGRSSTSPAMVVVALVLAVISLRFVFSQGFNAALVGVAVLVGAALLLARRGRPPGPAGAAPYPPPGTPAYGGYAPFAGTTTDPTMPAPPQASYGAPLAPHGPYATSSPYAASLGYPAAAQTAYPGLGTPPPPSAPPSAAKPPRPPKPPRQKSALTRLTLSAMCLSLGTLAILHLGGAVRVVPSAYVAVALGTVGLGLLVGAWLGRGRWLILLGVLLTIALPITTAAEHVRPHRVNNVTWAPVTVQEMHQLEYISDYANATLDLSGIDFTDHTETVETRVDVGNLTVILPPNVDVKLRARVSVGDATALGQHWGGVNSSTHTLNDNGADGPGGGTLELDARVDVGNLEVHR